MQTSNDPEIKVSNNGSFIGGEAEPQSVVDRESTRKIVREECEKNKTEGIWSYVVGNGKTDKLKEEDASGIVTSEREKDKDFFIKICQIGDEESIRFWLKYIENEDLEVTSTSITTALIEFIERKMPVELIEEFLDFLDSKERDLEVVLNASIAGGYTALMAAVYSKRIDVVKKLLENDDISISGVYETDGKTLIMMAIEKELPNEIIETLLVKANGNYINKSDSFGKNILMYAIEKGNIDIAKVISRYYKIDSKKEDFFGNTAYEYADKKLKDIKKMLDINKNDENLANTAKKFESILKKLKPEGKGEESKKRKRSLEEQQGSDAKRTHLSFSKDDKQVKRTKSKEIEKKSRKHTLNFEERREPKRAHVEYLSVSKLKEYFSRNKAIRSDEILEKIDKLDRRKKKEIVYFLAEKNFKDRNKEIKNDLLMYSIKNDFSRDVIGELLDNGADVNAKIKDKNTNEKYTILEFAIKNSVYYKTVEELLDYGATVTVKALKIAVEKDLILGKIKRLLDKGADMNAKIEDKNINEKYTILECVTNNKIYLEEIKELLKNRKTVTAEVLKNAIENEPKGKNLYGAIMNKLKEEGPEVFYETVNDLLESALKDKENDKVVERLFKHVINQKMKQETKDALLVCAVERGFHTNKISDLLEKGADVNARITDKDTEEETILEYAIKNNLYQSTIEKLVYYGATVTVKALKNAIENELKGRDYEILMDGLREKEPEVFYKTVNDLLESALKDKENAKVVEKLFEDVDIENIKQETKDALLAYAVENNFDKDKIKILLANRANPNMEIKDKNTNEKYTILEFAIKNSVYYKTVEELLDYGATVTVKALKIAIENESEELYRIIMNELRKKEDKVFYKIVNDLLESALKGEENIKVIKRLFEDKNVNIESVKQETKDALLMYAVENNFDKDKINSLLDKEADVNAGIKDKNTKEEETILEYLIKNNVHGITIEELLNYGENMTVKVLKYVIENESEELYRTLMDGLRKKEDEVFYKIVNDLLESALKDEGNAKVIDRLFEDKNLNIKEMKQEIKDALLVYAVRNSFYVDQIENLLNNGANVKAKIKDKNTKEEETILECAIKSGLRENKIKKLLEYGAKVTKKALKYASNNKECPVNEEDKETEENLLEYATRLANEEIFGGIIESLVYYGTEVTVKALKNAIENKSVRIDLYKIIMNELREKEDEVFYKTVNDLLESALKDEENVEVVKRLFEDKNVNIESIKQETKDALLVCAVRNKFQLNKIKNLLANGAKVTEKVLEYALENNVNNVYQEVIEELLKHEVTVTEKALEYAIKNKTRSKIIEELLVRGVNVNASIKDTVLEFAIKNEAYPETIKKLLECGAKVTAKALEYALENKMYQEVIEELLKHEVTVTAKALEYAIKNNVSSKIIKELVNHGANVNASIKDKDTEEEDTILEFAIKNNVYLQRIKELLGYGAKVTEKALKYALENKKINIEKELVDQLKNLDEENKENILCYILKNDDESIKEINKLLVNQKRKKGLVNPRAKVTVEALEYVSRNDYESTKEINKLLVNQKRKELVEIVENKGFLTKMKLLESQKDKYKVLKTALEEKMPEEVIELLLMEGARASVRPDKCNELLSIAVKNEIPVKIVELLFKNTAEDKITAQKRYSVELYNISKTETVKGHEKHLKSVEDKLLEYGVTKLGTDMDKRLQEKNIDEYVTINKIGKSKLMYYLEHGVLRGQMDILSREIERGTDEVNKRDIYGHTPLMYALVDDAPEKVIKLLLEKDANVNAKDNYGMTPLRDALAKRASEGVIDLLIKYGANVNEKDVHGRTLLRYALAKRASEGVIDLLIKHGANVNEKDVRGRTLLRYALEKGASGGVIEVLIKYGANVNEEDGLGVTPLEYALKNNAPKEVIDLLVEKGTKGQSEVTLLIQEGSIIGLNNINPALYNNVVKKRNNNELKSILKKSGTSTNKAKKSVTFSEKVDEKIYIPEEENKSSKGKPQKGKN